MGGFATLSQGSQEPLVAKKKKRRRFHIDTEVHWSYSAFWPLELARVKPN